VTKQALPGSALRYNPHILRLDIAHSPFKIVGVPSVIATVGTAENVYPKHFIYPFQPIRPSFDRLRTNGFLADYFFQFIWRFLPSPQAEEGIFIF